MKQSSWGQSLGFPPAALALVTDLKQKGGEFGCLVDI